MIIKIRLLTGLFLLNTFLSEAQRIIVNNQPSQLNIMMAGENSIHITLKPVGYKENSLMMPMLSAHKYPLPAISVTEIRHSIKKKIGNLFVEVHNDPLVIAVTNIKGEPVQQITFQGDGNITFIMEDRPVLGMGEGGPSSPVNSQLPEPVSEWNNQVIEFDRRGRLLKMEPRPQGGAYGSRNPVPMMVGTAGWGLWVMIPWGQVDLSGKGRGIFIPLTSPVKNNGILPPAKTVKGFYDVFIFDAHDPAKFMKDVTVITGPAVMPPKWALGYLQSFRTLQDEDQMIHIVDTFRAKKISIDAVIYLSTGFIARGWSKPQPSFEFNPEVFHRSPEKVISDLHARHVKVALHIWPGEKERLPTLHGSIPPKPGEMVDSFHIKTYWQYHTPLVKAGIDGFWPDAGDYLDLSERIKRHQLYYEGFLSARPNTRPWSLHRNGYLGIAKWGGWMWSGDIISSWKTLEAQIAVGINHSLSLSPYWGSDIGGFFPNKELTGELYARWFQFGAFCPCFRSHGKTWSTRLPWGWGKSDMGVLEGNRGNEPLASELNNPAIEPICKTYDDLRYQLMPYTYTMAWQARSTGMPLMRAMWLHYPNDAQASGLGSQYLWGPDLLIAPVFEKGATSREVYLPEGQWYDWWTNDVTRGGETIRRQVNLETMPIYVRAGAIIPFDPVRQYTGEVTNEPTTLKIYSGADGEFTLYEDDGISLDYLKGKVTLTRMKWNDKKKELIIEPAPGKRTTNVVKQRTYRIRIFPGGDIKNVDYQGKPVRIKF